VTNPPLDALELRFALFGRRFAGHGVKGLEEMNDFLNEAGMGDEALMAVMMRAYIDELLKLHQEGQLKW
jgi:hypothetical protein